MPDLVSSPAWSLVVSVEQELHELLIKPLPLGARLTAVFDSCHSGSVLDVRTCSLPPHPARMNLSPWLHL